MIEVKGIRKTFGRFVALDGIDLKVPGGELMALLGPSGSGKTTLLRIIAGLETPDCGSVHFAGEDATERQARDRGVGFVFQHYALFRHMTVFENVAFGLRVRPRGERPTEGQVIDRVMDLLSMVQLGPLVHRYPSQLSGGQRQRVALARALAVEPKVLLLDEPFGSLDARVRQELRQWLRRLHDTLHITSVFVTHDQEEALEVADRVVVMSQGRVEQVGTPEELFDRPATPFVMRFLGSVNVFHGRVQQGKAVLGPLLVDCPEHAHPEPTPVEGFARPHEIELVRGGNGGTLPATVQRLNAAGVLVKVELLDDEGHTIRVELTRERYCELRPIIGERLGVRPTQVRVFVKAEEEEPALAGGAGRK